jgi:O-antigen/teichoic acid export membrane protein
MDSSDAAEPSPEPRSSGYVKNVLWTWTGVVLNLFSGFILSPYVIHKLGPDGYGIWVLLFSVLGYYGLIDLGLRSAIVRFCADFYARNEFGKVNELINSALAYYTASAAVLLLIATFLSGHTGLFHVPPAFAKDFSSLLIVIGISFLFGMNVFSACLEGLQCFKLGIKVYILFISWRSIGTFILLYLGHGLIELMLNFITAQLLTNLLGYVFLRRVFPELQLSISFAKLSMLRHVASYALHTFVATIATQVLTQTPALILGFFRPTADIGYYVFPVRTLQYVLDFVMRVGMVSASRAAELGAKGRFGEVFSLAIYSNRYCLVIFMPFMLFILVYGHSLIAVWIGEEFARNSSMIFPVVALGSTLGFVAQFNSSSILFGLGKHERYAHGLLVEALVNVGLMFLLIPRFGIMGAAWAAAIPMIAVRGIYTPWLVCRVLGGSFAGYMWSVLSRPALTAVPVLLACYIGRLRLLPGNRWSELVIAGLLTTACYYTLALFTSVEVEHRSGLISRATRTLAKFRLALT